MTQRKNRKHYTRRSVSGGLAVCLAAGAVSRAGTLAQPSTPAQVEGPFYPLDSESERDTDLTLIEGHAAPATGEQILVRGIIRNTQGGALPNATVELWQANSAGRYKHPADPNPAPLDAHFQGGGIMTTSAEGSYGFKTVKPGPYPLGPMGASGWRCRHIHFKIACPGYRALTTQMYFEGDPLIAQDLVIAGAPRDTRHLLIAKAETDASGLPLYRFDIILASGDAAG
ncbi:MAG: protocatechuate 3,4-dioxygenase [Pseudomonadota bacterium]